MLFILLVIFSVSLIYLGTTERVKIFLNILVIQGIILFGIAFFQLKQVEPLQLAFVLLETVVVKSIGIPWFLNRTRRRNGIERLNESRVPGFVTVLAVIGIIMFSFWLGSGIHDGHVQTKFFSAAVAAVITGFYFIFTHRNIFTHLVGYLVIENGIFLLSLSVGAEMPMLVNAAILLDVFVAVLVLGVFVNRLSNSFEDMDIDRLTQLKD